MHAVPCSSVQRIRPNTKEIDCDDDDEDEDERTTQRSLVLALELCPSQGFLDGLEVDYVGVVVEVVIVVELGGFRGCGLEGGAAEEGIEVVGEGVVLELGFLVL